MRLNQTMGLPVYGNFLLRQALNSAIATDATITHIALIANRNPFAASKAHVAFASDAALPERRASASLHFRHVTTVLRISPEFELPLALVVCEPSPLHRGGAALATQGGGLLLGTQGYLIPAQPGIDGIPVATEKIANLLGRQAFRKIHAFQGGAFNSQH